MAGAAGVAMAAIGLGVGIGAALSPAALAGLYGIPPREMTGAGAFGWRLFGVRTVYLSSLALNGDVSARRAFLPIQLLDQAVFAHAYATRSIPRRAAALAMATSGAIIGLDLIGRRPARPRAPELS